MRVYVRVSQKAHWAMHKLECGAITAFGEKWSPSETVRLVARILANKVRGCTVCNMYHKERVGRGVLNG